MAASITDHFNKAADGNGIYPKRSTVSTQRTAGDSVLTCTDLSGWAKDTPVHFSTFRLNAAGEVDGATQTDWKGIVSSNSISNLTRIAGAADTGHAVGDIVEVNPTIGWLEDLVTGILVSHTQSGALKSGIVGSAALATSSVTDAKLAPNSVTGEKIASSAISSAKLAQSAVSSEKIASGAVTKEKTAASMWAFGNYSTTEQNTGFTWINGSTIYKKTITKTTGALSSDTLSVSTGLSLNSGNLVKVEAMGLRSVGTWLPITYSIGTTYVTVDEVSSNLSTVKLRGSDSGTLSNKSFYITLYYTKS